MALSDFGVRKLVETSWEGQKVRRQGDWFRTDDRACFFRPIVRRDNRPCTERPTKISYAYKPAAGQGLPCAERDKRLIFVCLDKIATVVRVNLTGIVSTGRKT